MLIFLAEHPGISATKVSFRAFASILDCSIIGGSGLANGRSPMSSVGSPSAHYGPLAVANMHSTSTCARRLKRGLDVSVAIWNRCGGSIKIIACIADPVAIEKIPTHLERKAVSGAAPGKLRPRRPDCSQHPLEAPIAGCLMPSKYPAELGGKPFMRLILGSAVWGCWRWRRNEPPALGQTPFLCVAVLPSALEPINRDEP